MPLRPFMDGPDDRQDDETRGRIREIQAGLVAWQKTVDDRYRKVVWLVILAVVLSFIAIGGTWALLRRTDRSATQNGAALCALRRDLEGRVTDSRRFLSTHPHGIPGIPAAQIRASITNSGRTIRALRVIDCS
jgi:nitrate reductase alpha subunit